MSLLLARAFLAAAAALAPAAALAGDLSSGKLLVDARSRYESLDLGGLDGQALTARLRLGWETPKVAGFTGLVEGEAVAVLVDDYADGITPRPGRPVIPDPDSVELNRAQITWAPGPAFEATLGRQRIVLNNARFVGNVGWRQNEQTFDAVKLVAKPSPAATLTYAFVGRVNRTIGRDNPQGIWRGDVHLMQADFKTSAGKLVGYGYLMDFSTAPAQSSATWGLRLTGERQLQSLAALTWELEYARQQDWRLRAEFDLDYILVAGGVKTAASSLGLVFERLDGDGRRGFQTPLATLHGFQGWSDVIGATPADGVRDIYLRGHVVVPLSRPMKISGEAHDFRSVKNARTYGREIDLAASMALAKPVNLEVGVARFDTSDAMYPDAIRAWVSMEYKY